MVVLSRHGEIVGLDGDPTGRVAVDGLRKTLTADHADAAPLVIAAGVFAIEPFVAHTAEDYDR